MAKNSIQAYQALGKTNLLMFDPNTLHLVTDEASPLYDSRVHLPVDEKLVLNIMHLGVLQPIIVSKNTETGATEVVAGRQRVKAAREANRRLEAKGAEPIQVPATVKRADGMTLASATAAENALREAETHIGRAEKMAKLMQLGRTEADLAIIFGCTAATVKATLALLDCSKAVRDAIGAGQINVSHAKALAKLEPEEQRSKVAELIAAGEGASGHERARKQRAVVDGEQKPKMKSRATINARYTDAKDPAERALLAWVLGVEE